MNENQNQKPIKKKVSALRGKKKMIYLPGDLIEWLSLQENQSGVIAMALRAWIASCETAPFEQNNRGQE